MLKGAAPPLGPKRDLWKWVCQIEWTLVRVPEYLQRNYTHTHTHTHRGSSQPMDRTSISCIAGRFFTAESPGKPIIVMSKKFSRMDRKCTYHTKEKEDVACLKFYHQVGNYLNIHMCYFWWKKKKKGSMPLRADLQAMENISWTEIELSPIERMFNICLARFQICNVQVISVCLPFCSFWIEIFLLRILGLFYHYMFVCVYGMFIWCFVCLVYSSTDWKEQNSTWETRKPHLHLDLT